MDKRLVLFLILVAIGLYTWPMAQGIFTDRWDPGTFVVHFEAPPFQTAEPYMHQEFINPDPVSPMVHVGSICELSHGRLAAAWYGGSREGAGNVSIFFSEKGPSETASWSEPKMVVDRLSASRELNRYVKKVGNPVLFSGADERLWLIYVTIAVGGWSGSSLNITWSDDAGITWSRSRRLTLSPFFNISELVRNRPLLMSNQGFAVPIYHECLGNFPEILWLQPMDTSSGIRYKKSRMAGGTSYIQPSVVPFGPAHAVAFYRCQTEERAVGRAVSRDAGTTWSPPRNLSLPNPDAALAAVRLSNQQVLLAFNDSATGRETLSLAVSRDQGRHWCRIITIEDTSGKEFSYPYLIRTKDGRFHLVYTWCRKRIKHMAFNEAWIQEQIKGASP